MMIGRVNTVCNGVESGGSGLAQRGNYVLTEDNLVIFRPTPPYGPAFSATFDSGTYQPGSGGRLPNLRFSFAQHDFWVIADVP